VTAQRPVDVEAALRQLSGALEVAAAPDYAARVLHELERGTRPRGILLRPHGVSKLLVAAAVAIAAVATTVAIPATRHALTSWFGFSGIELRTAPSSQSPLPTPSSGPPAPRTLGFGRPATLRAARIATGGRLELPGGLAPPRRVFMYRQGGATVVTVAYRRVPGLEPTPETGFALLLTEIFDAGQPIFEKLLHAGTDVVEVRVHGLRGVYVRGPQEIMNAERTILPNGEQIVHEVAPRASADTIIWSDRGATYRLEADMTRRVALELARSMR